MTSSLTRPTFNKLNNITAFLIYILNMNLSYLK